MRKVITFLSLSLIFTSLVSAQEETEKQVEGSFNKWSIDLNAGLSKPTAPFSPNYYASNTNFIHGDLGLRYMLNSKFGLKLDFGLDSFKNKSESFEFDGKYFRTDLQGVINLGRVLNFEEWTNTVNLQAHTGLGFSFMTNDKFDGNDDMTNFILGLTAQFRLSNRIALNADFTMVNNVNQTYTFDGMNDPSVVSDRGFNGTLYNASIGFSFYLGKNEKHADWFIPRNKQLDELEARVAELETMMNDTDRDGVPDYLDAEPNTITGVAVDTKGRAVDMNKNGIPDEIEKYIENVKGGSNTNVNNSTNQSVEDLINGGYINVYFDTNSSKPIPSSYAAIQFVTQYLKSNSNASVEVIGYADEVGTSEYNDKLSSARAAFVKDVIVKAGIDASRLVETGKGEDNSVENSAYSRKLVRRVTFKLK
ncbi:Flagellar motor protein MotB [Flavobacterium sp. 9AF]|uniref:OmpA family protein n=1 Tax=Flavobacterium sp. 9AF TaxID=2653142 RepID=UPI0012F393DD|nr:OmpA family protein [Flavobacterium sp. 9AF]VXC03893.1 Flagellar motor protein MotB [Flavobacterium sp. 9AF]